MPLRVWILGYALQCVLHMICVCLEFKRRREQGISSSIEDGESTREDSPRDVDERDYYEADRVQDETTRYE